MQSLGLVILRRSKACNHRLFRPLTVYTVILSGKVRTGDEIRTEALLATINMPNPAQVLACRTAPRCSAYTAVGLSTACPTGCLPQQRISRWSDFSSKFICVENDSRLTPRSARKEKIGISSTKMHRKINVLTAQKQL